jgi:hypothetical protein
VDGLAVAAADEFDVVAWTKETRELLAALPATFDASPIAARGALRSLLTTPITVTPEVEDGVLRVRFSGECRYATLDGGLLTSQSD